MSSLVDTIRAEHRNLSARLQLLEAEVARAEAGEGDVALLDLLAQFFATFPDKIHHAKEHKLYYVLIRQGVAEDAYLRRLKEEHRQIGAVAARFADDLCRLNRRGRAPSPFLVKRIRRFIAMQELHMADEESQFLPLVAAALPVERLAAIEAESAAEFSDAEHRTWAAQIAAVEAAIDARLLAR